ncbi:MAG: hypothetical protein KatS3mg104_2626 [Phycisphaerae bacterium]|nr:MAG: hypothetical protein KatS3mg104_2626 [Phycisphaerae bacterium]
MRTLIEPDQRSGRGYVPPPASSSYRSDRRAWRWLSPTDRTILELLELGASRRTIGSIVRMNSGHVSRRIRAIRLRLGSSTVRKLLEPGCPLPDPIRDLACDYFIGGASIRHLSRRHGLSVSVIQEQLSFAKGMLTPVRRRIP